MTFCIRENIPENVPRFYEMAAPHRGFAWYEHIRSRPDEVVRAIVDTGGLVGIRCVPPVLWT